MQLTLKKARERAELTFAQLAAKSGVHKATVARIERGEVEPMHATVIALEDALGLERGTLVFGRRSAA
jgi:transcriptional regulator with XRE-family HTH domain